MDKDRERFARLAERAKQPPFTPLDNLLERGRPELAAGDYPTLCGCDDCTRWAAGRNVDERVVEALRRMRKEPGSESQRSPGVPSIPHNPVFDTSALDRAVEALRSFGGALRSFGGGWDNGRR